MKKTLLTAVAVLGMSIGTAQAVQLDYQGTFSADGEVDQYSFQVLGNNSSVDIWMDTLQDGYDSAAALFKLNASTGAYDWTGQVLGDGGQQDFDVALGYNTTGLNDFGVALKNGFVQNSPTNLGVSDLGQTVTLDTGTYLLAVLGFEYWSTARLNGSGILADGFFNFNDFQGNNPEREWSTWTYNTGGTPSPYNLFIDGDVAKVSAVPVPAAVWLFTTAIAGLGVVRRKKA